MATIAWSTSTPGDDSTASAVDDQIRSDLTAIQTGLQEFMYWDDGSATSDGEFKAGTLRVGITTRSAGTASVLSTSESDGWLKWDTMQAVQNNPAAAPNGAQGGGMYLFGGNATSDDTRPILVGHPMMSEMSTSPGSTVSATWVRCAGQTVFVGFGSNLNSTISYGVKYDVPPYLWSTTVVRIAGSTDTVAAQAVQQVSDETASIRVWHGKANIFNLFVFGTTQWVSEGTVTYG